MTRESRETEGRIWLRRHVRDAGRYLDIAKPTASEMIADSCTASAIAAPNTAS